MDEPNFEKDNMMTYNTMVHPQNMKNDKILMCYNVNTYDLKKVFDIQCCGSSLSGPGVFS